jgi:uncharacterized OsmC-like protein
MKTKSILVEGYQSLINNGRNHSIVTDLPDTSQGQDTGATALEVSLMSLAGCISTIFKKVADKMRINVEKLEVDMNADKGQETFDVVRYKVYVKSDAPKEKLEKCLDTTENTCPVGVLFSKAGVKIDRELIKI